MRGNGKVKKIYDDAIIPTLASEKSAGFDLYFHNFEDKYCEEVLRLNLRGVFNYEDELLALWDPEEKILTICPHKTIKIGTGVAITPPEGYFGGILARSGLATKRGLAPANKVGVADEDYTGEYIVALHNHSDKNQTIKLGDRIAQLVFIPYNNNPLIEVDNLEETERGASGFGDSGN